MRRIGGLIYAWRFKLVNRLSLLLRDNDQNLKLRW
jgi:hypothetical protein